MAILTWGGGGLGNNASESGNWIPAQTPIAGDNVNFNGGTLKQCHWDIVAKMNAVASPPPSDDSVLQVVKLTCFSFDWQGGGQWTRNGQDIEFDSSFVNNGGVFYSTFTENDICNSADPTSTYDSFNNPIANIHVAKILGTFRKIDPSNFQNILLEGTNGTFIFEWPAGGFSSGVSFSSQGTIANSITVQKNGLGPAPTITVSAAGVDSAYTSFQDMTFNGAGSPIIATDNCTDNGGNTGITFTVVATGLKQADILTALADRLQNDAGLLAICGDAEHIKNHLPQDLTFPYVRFHLATNNEWDWKTAGFGFEGTIVCDCWTDEHGDLVVHQLIDAIIVALNNAPLTLQSGAEMLLVRHSTSNTVIEPDGKTHHGSISFRHLSYEE